MTAKEAERIAKLEVEIKNLREDIGDLKENHIGTIYKKIDCLEKKITGRPSWSTTALITILSSGFFTVLALYLSSLGR